MNVYSLSTKDFDLGHTLSCGQVFRWKKNDWWSGVVDEKVVRAKQEGSELLIDSSIEKKAILDYFRLDDDMEKIYATINRDSKIAPLIQKYRGLHLIRQDPWECLVSYICSSNNTIRNITNSIRRMCECFGNNIEDSYYSFPRPERLSEIGLCEIAQCRMGFRAQNVLNIAKKVADGEFDLYGIKGLPYIEGREELMKIKGVGEKIADCVLLFAFGNLESFPVDTHIEQIMERFYGKNFIDVKKSRKREEIARFARRYFGIYCGYAQEYLYMEDLNLEP